MLQEGSVSHEFWNTIIHPAVKSGVLKDRSELLPNISVYIHIVMCCLIEDEDGKLYKCEGDIFERVVIKLWKPNINI